MEYHKDRFQDYSLLVFKGNTLIAVLPANRYDDTVVSHQGLTYGGLVLEENIGVAKVEAIFLEIINYLKKDDIEVFRYKSIPLIYHKLPSFELEPLLHTLSAVLYRREQNLAIDFRLPLNIHKTKIKHFKKNQELGFEIRKTKDFSLFWNKVLIPRLKEKHQAKPVHTLEEIQVLGNHFEDNIYQYEIYLNEEILAGITIFKSGKVIKSQYGAITNNGEKYRALDYLYLHLILKYKEAGFIYFDMGTVVGNTSLLKQKEELGCYQYLQDFYELKL